MKAIVSWGDLTVYLGVFLFLYYLAILLIFFRREIFFRVTLRRALEPVADTPDIQRMNPLTSGTAAPQDDVAYHQVMELLEDLKPVFKSAADEKQHTDQILAAVKSRLGKYPSIKGSTFQTAVSNHIEQSLQSSTGVLLSAEDISSVW